jgi:hypothetical protein
MCLESPASESRIFLRIEFVIILSEISECEKKNTHFKEKTMFEFRCELT